jgi:hypothetical protein
LPSRGFIAEQANEALNKNSDWQAICSACNVNRDLVTMFKITQNSLHYFTLAELLLMAAINQRETKRKSVEDDRCLGETDPVTKCILEAGVL